jgi:two-component system nitrogen regulation response regulator GlnG
VSLIVVRSSGSWSRSSLSKHVILFLAANPVGTTELALGREARAIQDELERSGHRDQFEFVTRWAVEPLDLIRELRKLKPTVVHFSGHGGWPRGTKSRPSVVVSSRDVDTAEGEQNHTGLFFQGLDGLPQLVTAAALRDTFGAAGASVKLVVLNACYSAVQADALLEHVDCVVGSRGSLRDDAARAFAIGFYGGLGERQSVAAAHAQGCAAISLEQPRSDARPQLRVRAHVDADQIVLAETGLVSRDRPVPVYPDPRVAQLSKLLEDAWARRDKLRSVGIATDDVDREVLELRRQLREGGQLRAGDALSDGRYLLVKIAGRGGFAVVWEAYDCAAQRRVAIKVLHSNLAGDPQRRERFFRGARAMMNLTHPGVVRVLDPRGEDGGFYYFVMEFVTGGNLREATLAQRIKKDDRIPLIIRVGEALAAAHTMGMIHRDIKPTNVLLDERGDAKLTDFDLVSAHDTTGGTRTGALGTVVYAAPECLDRPQEATTRADVFGLGMTAIFCLSGQDVSMLTFRNPEATISELDCSYQIQDVLRRAVQWEPGQRFADVAELTIALRNASTPIDRNGATSEFSRIFRGRRREDLRGLVPALTIVSHPFSPRVGERCLLDAVDAGYEVRLSRNEPDFVPPGRILGGPLRDPFISRKPIRFAPGPRGGIRVTVDAGVAPVVIAGTPLDGSADFTADDLVRGVALELAERIVVLLHLVDRVQDTADPHGLIGVSAGIRRVRTAIERVVDPAPVLILGEAGSGKEQVARALHARSPRRGGPFVSVALGAIRPEFAYAELFGSTREAASPAARDGLFHAAHGGTLFLDEIDKAPPEVAFMLLRFMKTGEVYPVGAERSVATPVRLIAATEAGAADHVQRDHLKADLLDRLAVFEVRIPPLRERRDDIGLLFYRFAREELLLLGEHERLSPADPYARPWLSTQFAAQLVRHSWPGNVRELRNVTRALVLANHASPHLPTDPPLADSRDAVLQPISDLDAMAAEL